MSLLTRAAASTLAVMISLSTLIAPVQAAALSPSMQPYAQPAGRMLVSNLTSNKRSKHAKLRIDKKFERQLVTVRTAEPAGTIIVNTGDKFLYLLLGDGKAMRYGIGVARDGFEWSGTHRISNMREWPSWTPPAAMRKRQPGLPAFMEGGEGNPLGARALYLGSTLYRIHGTNEPWTIGGNVSSGCIRMINDDVVDLFSRVKIGTKVIVL